MRTTPDTPQVPDIEARIEQLLQRSAGIAPADVMALLKRAETNPGLDVQQELERLRSS